MIEFHFEDVRGIFNNEILCMLYPLLHFFIKLRRVYGDCEGEIFVFFLVSQEVDSFCVNLD
jgi:hypothetical protein